MVSGSHGIYTGFPTLPDSGSQIQFRLIREWLHNCDNCHKCQPQHYGNLPTRLIDVGDRTSQPFVRLECDTRCVNAKYFALSHQWGAAGMEPSFKTLSNNLGCFKESIDLYTLPRTFQDAVIVTRELGVRFLWIDSPCIIQDSEEDWVAESAKMGHIFNSAYCTIAASRANSTAEGFLGPRQERTTVEIRRPENATFYVSEMIDDFRGDIEEGKLNRRGWVLQERALSRRTIYFGERQTYWECGWGVRCETLSRIIK